jgi:DNA modification methylase
VKSQDRPDVWEGFSMNSFTQREKESIDGIEHPTIKPIKMLMDFITNSSNTGGIILDAFAGSGTTIMAAEKTRRVCYGMELDPRYVDVTLRRYAKYTGQEPVREADGKKWSEL